MKCKKIETIASEDQQWFHTDIRTKTQTFLFLDFLINLKI